MKKKLIYSSLLLITAIGIGFTGCKKALDLKPENLTLNEDAIKTTADVQALLNSCYDEFANLMNGSVQNLHELRGENLAAPQSTAGSLYFSVYSRGTFSFRTADKEYLDFYNCILRINTIFKRIDEVTDMSAANKKRIMAEGYFLRAWSHWEIVKLWAQPYGFTADNSHPGIPIRLKADKEVQIRSTVKQVYDQILTDLNLAEADLPADNGNYASQNAAKGLKAKIYFLMHDYTNAHKYADELCKDVKYKFADTFARFTVDAGDEVIFKLVSTGNSDNRGSAFINNYRSDNNPNPTLKPTSDFMAIATQGHDNRRVFYETKNKGKSNEFNICHKFDKDFFNVPLIHLTEMKLIRAESITEMGGDQTVAIADVNDIRQRAYGSNFVAIGSSISPASLRDSVRLQRNLEMAFEGDWTLQKQRRGAQGENVKIRTSIWNCPGLILQFPASEKTAGFVFNAEGGCN